MADLDLGPAKVEWNSVDLGYTLGGIVVRFTEDATDLKADQTGTGAEDSVVTGHVVEVDVPLAEENYKTLAAALKGTSVNTDPSSYAIYGSSQVGRHMKANAQALVLTKYVDGEASTDDVDKYTFNKAYPVANVEMTFDAENQRVIKVTFKCFKDDDGYYYIIGDSSATATA